MSETDLSRRVYGIFESPLGGMDLVAENDAITGAYFEGQAHFPMARDLGKRKDLTDHPVLEQAARELAEYFAGTRTVFEVALHPEGTDFQLAVWEHLKGTAYGYTTTYGAISKVVGPHAPAQAVGQAVGRNKCSIFIPCHRVLSADGKLTGYAGGLDRKEFLLDFESPSAEEKGQLF